MEEIGKNRAMENFKRKSPAFENVCEFRTKIVIFGTLPQKNSNRLRQGQTSPSPDTCVVTCVALISFVPRSKREVARVWIGVCSFIPFQANCGVRALQFIADHASPDQTITLHRLIPARALPTHSPPPSATPRRTADRARCARRVALLHPSHHRRAACVVLYL